MKYPDQWSVKPSYKLYYITVSWYEFISMSSSGALSPPSLDYMCCMSTPVEYSITSNTHHGDIVEANCYVHCDNWRIDLDEHVHSSFVHS